MIRLPMYKYQYELETLLTRFDVVEILRYDFHHDHDYYQIDVDGMMPDGMVMSFMHNYSDGVDDEYEKLDYNGIINKMSENTLFFENKKRYNSWINVLKKLDKKENKTMLNIKELTENARYSYILDEVINLIGGKEVLRIEYESDWSGYVDIDVLLDDNRVFSYKYNYGSCSGCDEWEANELDKNDIKEIMLQESTIFDNIDSYNKWRLMVEDKSRGKLT